MYGIDLAFGHVGLVLLTLSVTTTRKGDLLPRSRGRTKIHARTITSSFATVRRLDRAFDDERKTWEVLFLRQISRLARAADGI